MTDKSKRGGPNRGQGRKRIKADEETVSMTFRLTAAQRAKLERLGGAAFLRAAIDRAEIMPA